MYKPHTIEQYKIQLIDEQGSERTLLLSKTAKFQIGARYRFYFQKEAGLPSGTTIWTLPSPPIVFLDTRHLRTQHPVIKSRKAGSKHPMSKKKGYGTKVIASVPYPSILLFSSGSRGLGRFR